MNNFLYMPLAILINFTLSGMHAQNEA